MLVREEKGRKARGLEQDYTMRALHTASPPLCFCRHRVNDVGFDEFDTACAKGSQIHFSNSRFGFVVHLLERPAISRSKHYRPPVLGRLKGLLTVLCGDVSIFDSALCQKLANGLRCDNPLPRVKGGMEIGAKL